MVTKGKLSLFSKFFIILIVLSTGVLAGCSPRHINILSNKVNSNKGMFSSNIRYNSEKSGSNDSGHKQTIQNENIISEDCMDEQGKENEIIISNDNIDKPSHRDEDSRSDADKSLEENDSVDLGVDTAESSDLDEPWLSDVMEAAPVAAVLRNESNPELKRVALTFDDGPDDVFTPQILDILKEYDVKATFFVLGYMARDNQDVLKRMDEEGHTIGSHSWSHKDFTKISNEARIDELSKTNNLIEDLIGRPVSLFRLPYGAYTKDVLHTVANQGYHNIYWSIDPKDWASKSPNQILNNIQQNLKPGSIILLHSSGNQSTISNTVKSLPGIIDFLWEQGYEIVTIPKLLEEDLGI